MTNNLYSPKMNIRQKSNPLQILLEEMQETGKMSESFLPSSPDRMSESFLNSAMGNICATDNRSIIKEIPSAIYTNDNADKKKNKDQKILQTGQEFGRYLIEGELGRGGMGVVYKAYDNQLKRVVALKVILRGDRTDVIRFMRESTAMAQLDHPGIVSLYDFGEQPLPHITMEYVEGFTLAHLIKEKKVRPLFLIEVMIKVCEALAHAHKYKVLHRDIKPSNIMISRKGEPKIMDFGLAKISNDSQQSLSKSGDVLGTILYMAPEQVTGNPTYRSDIYSIGATIYEALTYRNVYQGENYHNVFFQILHNTPIPLRQLNPDISPYFEAVCLKCLAKKQNKRYGSFKQLVRELKNLRDHRPLTAKKYTSWDTFKSFANKHKMLFSGIVIIAIVLCLSFFAVIREKDKTKIALNKVTDEKNKTKIALNKVMNALDYSLKKYEPLRKDKHFSSLFSEVFEYVEEYGENQDWSFVKAYITSQTGNIQKSVGYYTTQIRKNPGDVNAYRNRGLLYSKMGKHKKALSDFEKLIQLSPNYAEAYNNCATAYLELNNYEKALANYHKAIELNPLLFRGYYGKGLVYLNQKKYEKALQYCNKAIELNSDFFRIYNTRGIIYRNLRKYHQAFADYKKVIELKPLYIHVYRNRGFLFYSLGRYEEALADFSKTVTLNPKYHDGYYNRAMTYKNLAKYLEAINDYNKAIEIKPHNPLAYSERAFVFFLLGKYERAILDYSTAIKQKPKYYQAYLNRSGCYIKLKQYTQAIEDLTYATSINDNDWLPYSQLAICYKALGNKEKEKYFLQKMHNLKKK